VTGYLSGFGAASLPSHGSFDLVSGDGGGAPPPGAAVSPAGGVGGGVVAAFFLLAQAARLRARARASTVRMPRAYFLRDKRSPSVPSFAGAACALAAAATSSADASFDAAIDSDSRLRSWSTASTTVSTCWPTDTTSLG
jgi:hypothetical protein